MPLNDLIDIGVLNGKKDEEKPLYLKKDWMTTHSDLHRHCRSAANSRGIDPYNKLIDRNADDNLIDVTKQ